jgi:hypothetical protein
MLEDMCGRLRVRKKNLWVLASKFGADMCSASFAAKHRRPPDGLRELGPLQAYVLPALILNLVLRAPFKLFGHAILRPSLLHRYSLGWLHVGPSVL